LILSEPDARGDIEVAMITGSNAYEGSLLISDSDYLEGALPKTSYVRGDRILKVRLTVVERLTARLTLEFIKKARKAIIAQDTRAFSRLAHSANRPGDDVLRLEAEQDNDLRVAGSKGSPATSHASPATVARSVPYAGRVFTEDEVEAAVSATLDFWLTLGPEGEAFEKELAAFLGVKHSLLVNSGSSANLIAICALTTHKLPDHKRLRPGDEVITCAAGFPTTVAPILQVGCIPVFIDNDPATGNALVSQLDAAFSAGKTKAVMFAHTLGNPFDLAAVLAFCKNHDLWLIEDNCDALGCTYSLPVDLARELGLDHLLKLADANLLSGGGVEMLKGESVQGAKEAVLSTSQPLNLSTKIPFIENGILTAYTGSFGDISTQSFYPPHHLTMGEGGAVNIIRRPPLKTYAESFRDWGRDCWCPSGKDNTCAKRFGWQLGELPDGYDHKYIYSHLGYNLKPLDPQAAIGRVQLRRLPAFIEARKQNWEILRRGLADLGEFFDFSLPTHATAWSSHATSSFFWDDSGCRTDCSWFGFMLRVKPSAPFTVREFAAHLDEQKIGNRMLFGGNLLRQPAFVQLRKDNPNAFRVVGEAKAKSQKRKEETVSAFSFQPSAFSLLPGADEIMHTAIFLGTYPGLTQSQLDYEIAVIRAFVGNRSKKDSQG